MDKVRNKSNSQRLGRPTLHDGEIPAGSPNAQGRFEQPIPSFQEILQRFPDFFEQALTPKEAAALIDSTPAALAQMRTRGRGPLYFRLPTITSIDSRARPRGPIRYRRRDVIEWLRKLRRFSNTSEELI